MFNFRRNILISLISFCLFIFTSSTFANPLKWIPQNSGTTTPLNSISYGNGRYVVTSTNGLLLTSTDAINWTQETFGTATLMSVTYNPLIRRFIAVGNSGTIITSADGLQWVAQTSGTPNNLNGIATSNTMIVAVGNEGTLLYSTNGGLNWNVTAPVAGNWLAAVTHYDNGHGYNSFVAVGMKGIILQSTDGIRWIARSSGVTSDLYGVTASANKIIAVGTNGVALISTDGGISWTQQIIDPSLDLWGITYSSRFDEFAAVGSFGVVAKSKDGVHWVATELSGITSPLTSVIYGNNQFVTVGENGVLFSSGPTFRKIMYALDSFAAIDNKGDILTSYWGDLWTNTTSSSSCKVYDMTFNDDEKAVVAFGSSCILKSTDLVKWTQQAAADGPAGNVCYANHLYISSSGSTIVTSSDGINWSGQTLDEPNLGKLACANNTFVAIDNDVGTTPPTSFLRSTDGFHWQRIPNGGSVGAQYTNIIGGNSEFISVGDAEYGRFVATSADGISWGVYHPERIDGSMISAARGGNTFVAIAPGIIYTSASEPWNKQLTNTNMTDVVYGNGRFVIIGDTVLTSPDGITWTDQVENFK